MHQLKDQLSHWKIKANNMLLCCQVDIFFRLTSSLIVLEFMLLVWYKLIFEHVKHLHGSKRKTYIKKCIGFHSCRCPCTHVISFYLTSLQIIIFIKPRCWLILPVTFFFPLSPEVLFANIFTFSYTKSSKLYTQ